MRAPPLAASALAVLSFVTATSGCRSFPDAAPVAPHPAAPARALALDGAARAHGAKVKLHLLHVGDTLVPFDQFFSGNDGAVGLSGIWRVKTDQRRFWVPVTCALVVHPSEGPILVDTCVSRAQGEPGYYRGIAANVHNDDVNRIPPGADLVTQLAALGVRPEDVRHVVLTHLHEDHVGELRRFPNATVHVAKAEWEHRDHRPLFVPVYYEGSWRGLERVASMAFDDGAFGPFAAAEDLFGDGTVIALPTVGHTPGHASVLVNGGEYDVVLSGDAFYTLRHLDPASLSAFSAYDEGWQALHRDSVERLVALRQALPEVHFVAQHDPFAGTRDLFLAAFHDGRLDDEERSALLSHTRALYDERGRLRPAALPRFEPGRDDGIGRVVPVGGRP